MEALSFFSGMGTKSIEYLQRDVNLLNTLCFFSRAIFNFMNAYVSENLLMISRKQAHTVQFESIIQTILHKDEF